MPASRNSQSNPTRRRGAPPGNLNNFKHGFYSRRIKKRDLSGLESTDVSGLVEELALIRIYTRRLVETFDPSSDFYQHADLLRVLCLASSAITRIIRAQALINTTNPGFDDVFNQALSELWADFEANPHELARVPGWKDPSTQPASSSEDPSQQASPSQLQVNRSSDPPLVAPSVGSPLVARSEGSHPGANGRSPNHRDPVPSPMRRSPNHRDPLPEECHETQS
jgi:hypothetical protein